MWRKESARPRTLSLPMAGLILPCCCTADRDFASNSIAKVNVSTGTMTFTGGVNSTIIFTGNILGPGNDVWYPSLSCQMIVGTRTHTHTHACMHKRLHNKVCPMLLCTFLDHMYQFATSLCGVLFFTTWLQIMYRPHSQ